MKFGCLIVAIVASVSAGPRGFQPSGVRSPQRLALQVTYAKDVAPLLVDRCGMCHHPGGSAPFSVLDYETVKTHAPQIAAATESLLMPPWLPDRTRMTTASTT